MRKHIVIIADDLSSLETFTALLEKDGYVVSTLCAFPSINELAFLRPDCFIINEWLPEICGHAICLMLKAQVQTRNTPVILISDAGENDPLENKCEADLILKRPYEPYNLAQIVSLVIRNALSIQH